MEQLIDELLKNKPYFDISNLTEDLPYNKLFRVDERALTLIHLAAIRSNKVLTKVLEFNPNINQSLMDTAWVKITHHCTMFTPLFMAILNDKIDNAFTLINAGADLKITCQISGHSALSLAIFCEKWDLALELFNRQATIPLQENRQHISVLEKITQSKDPLAKKLKELIFSQISFQAFKYKYTSEQLSNMKWRVLPTQLLWDLEYGSSLEQVLNVSSPRIKQLIYKKIFSEKINFTFLSFFYIFSGLELEYNFLCNFFEQVEITEAYSWTESDLKTIRASVFFLKRFYSEKMIENFLMKTYVNQRVEDLEELDGIWQDVFSQAEILEMDLKDHQIKKLLPKKLKNLIQFHDELSLMMTKRKQKNYSILQDDLAPLHNTKFKDFTLWTPGMNYELIHAGIELKICVGGGQYGKKILEKKSQIILLKKENGEVAYCVEIDYSSKDILQAKTRHNVNMSDNMQEELQTLLNHSLWWPGRA